MMPIAATILMCVSATLCSVIIFGDLKRALPFALWVCLVIVLASAVECQPR